MSTLVSASASKTTGSRGAGTAQAFEVAAGRGFRIEPQGLLPLLDCRMVTALQHGVPGRASSELEPVPPHYLRPLAPGRSAGGVPLWRDRDAQREVSQPRGTVGPDRRVPPCRLPVRCCPERSSPSDPRRLPPERNRRPPVPDSSVMLHTFRVNRGVLGLNYTLVTIASMERTPMIENNAV